MFNKLPFDILQLPPIASKLIKPDIFSKTYDVISDVCRSPSGNVDEYFIQSIPDGAFDNWKGIHRESDK